MKRTLANHPIFGRPSGFHSGHVGRIGQRFGVITDFETDPNETVVYLRDK